MIRDITLGQFYPADSYIHALDPRVKLIGSFVFITSMFFVNNLFTYLFVIPVLAAAIHISKVPPKFMLKGLKSIFMIICFTVFLNIFFTPGEHVIVRWGIFTITQNGLYTAALMSIRLMLIIVGSSLLTLTTSPIQLTDAIEFLLKPLKRIGVPSHEIALMMTIAMRFIPTLLEETDKIMKAQMARGADFDTGGIVKKAKSLIPLLVPLFVSAFRRADELAIAMESRCYNGDKNRTRMKLMKLTHKDFVASMYLVLYMSIIVAVYIFLKRG